MKFFDKLLCFFLLCIMAAMSTSVGKSFLGLDKVACNGRRTTSAPATTTAAG